MVGYFFLMNPELASIILITLSLEMYGILFLTAYMEHIGFDTSWLPRSFVEGWFVAATVASAMGLYYHTIWLLTSC